MKSHDVAYHQRLLLLAELMEAPPYNQVKKLQKTALRLLPVQSKELYRHCMSIRYAFKAADIANQPILEKFYEEG